MAGLWHVMLEKCWMSVVCDRRGTLGMSMFVDVAKNEGCLEQNAFLRVGLITKLSVFW